MTPRVFWIHTPLGKQGLRANLKKNKPTKHPTMLDIAWAAGLYEGEGSISAKTVVKSGKRYSSTPAICLTQKHPWIVFKLRALFGGKCYKFLSSNKAVGSRKYHRWVLHGPRARGFAYTIYTFLSPRRRKQIQYALGIRRVVQRAN